jgi:two-component system, chemotaxis family, protein-glutamate methylesterase/glutaminase
MLRAATPDLPGVLPEIRHLIAIGASAGGLHSIFSVLEPLPVDLDCCITIATHLSQTHDSILAELLGRRAKMTVVPATDNQPLRNGIVFVAQPRFHLAVSADHLHLIDRPPVQFLRPNIDVLFESVAQQYGSRAIGVILSGTGHDGSEGIRAIKMAGGTTIIEDPTFAEFADMPVASKRTGCVDFVLPLEKIGERLIDICSARKINV